VKLTSVPISKTKPAFAPHIIVGYAALEQQYCSYP
jgi:hypothetical protein